MYLLFQYFSKMHSVYKNFLASIQCLNTLHLKIFMLISGHHKDYFSIICKGTTINVAQAIEFWRGEIKNISFYESSFFELENIQ